MIFALLCVLEDGSEPPGTVPPLEPKRQDVAVPRGEDVTIEVTVVGRDGHAANLAGMRSLTLTCRRYKDDEVAAFTATSTDVDLGAGRVDIAVPSAATIGLEEQLDYYFEIDFVDANGLAWQLLRVSRWKVERIMARP